MPLAHAPWHPDVLFCRCLCENYRPWHVTQKSRSLVSQVFPSLSPSPLRTQTERRRGNEQKEDLEISGSRKVKGLLLRQRQLPAKSRSKHCDGRRFRGQGVMGNLALQGLLGRLLEHDEDRVSQSGVFLGVKWMRFDGQSHTYDNNEDYL